MTSTSYPALCRSWVAVASSSPVTSGTIGGAPAVDDDVMTNENGKALRLFELHRQRGNLPLRAQRLLDVQNFLRIGSFVLFDELMQIGAKCSGCKIRCCWPGFRHHQCPFCVFTTSVNSPQRY
jgi:hypothetical protein